MGKTKIMHKNKETDMNAIGKQKLQKNIASVKH